MKTWHIFSHIQLALITLPWKRNLLVFDRPLLIAEYHTTMKSVSGKAFLGEILCLMFGPLVLLLFSAVLFMEMIPVSD